MQRHRDLACHPALHPACPPSTIPAPLPRHTHSLSSHLSTLDRDGCWQAPHCPSALPPEVITGNHLEDPLGDFCIQTRCHLGPIFREASCQLRPSKQGLVLSQQPGGVWCPSAWLLCCSVAQSCPTLWDPMGCSMPGLPVYHQLPELTQTHVHQVSDGIQPSHPLSSPSPPAFNLSQHQGLFQ